MKNRVIVIVGIFAILMISFFVVRKPIANYALSKVHDKIESRLHLNFKVEKAEFKGLLALKLSNVSITDSLMDTTLYANEILVRPKIWYLFTGKLRLRELHINQSYINIDSSIVSSVLKHKKDEKTDTLVVEVNYKKTVERIFGTLFSLIPKKVVISDCRITILPKKITVSVPVFTIVKDKMQGNISVNDDVLKNYFSIHGEMDSHWVSFRLFNDSIEADHKKVTEMNDRWGMGLMFDSITSLLHYNGVQDGRAEVVSEFSLFNFSVFHKKLSPVPVSFRKLQMSFDFKASEQTLFIDSSSVISFNGFTFSPFVKYSRTDHKYLELGVKNMEFCADSFFRALPEGLFENIRDIKAEGKLAYRLKVNIILDTPDSVKVLSDLESKKFRIVRYGNANFSMLNDTFHYTFYDHGVPTYSMLVGQGIGDYTRLDQISDFLKYAVLTSEDGGFFYHRGFNVDAIQEAIAENIKKKRFVRGASTISMQLVKNVFLTRNKNISRKLEEIMIVWMIENLHLVSKEKMFEVYLNIIEWGPGVFGIKQAANYYFSKKPSELTLEESIFLAAIIPSPKAFKYCFDENKQLKSCYDGYYKMLSNIMLSRNQITVTDTAGLKANVILKGRALEALKKDTAMVVDSVEIDEPFMFLTE
ncbi:MAG TPA: biosynthetic peptidoglycan transglycosylase [Bacteroidales bacterium]|nr:biosynthetic peptidoglycan transglycosylase [Bacteroidales bacterium]